MAARTVRVILIADVAAFRARMAEAARETGRTSRTMRESMRDTARSMDRIGRNQQRTLQAVQMGSLALVAAFGFAVAAAAKFDKAMSNVRAVTQASAEEMTTLRAAALEAGRTTQFSAVQAADAMHELAKAGVSTADIAGGALTGALNLAAAAEVDVAEGAEIAANAMTVFGLKGSDVGHIADLLAAAANKSTTDVHQMGMSLRMAGQVASQTGLSIEDTVGALTLFAAEGLKGSDAGTSFKVMLQRLTPNSKEAQATLDQLGLSAYDAAGNFVGLQAFAGRMQEAFKNLTPEARNAAMGVIFGSDAVRAANILYKYGTDGLKAYTDAVNDNGYAQAVAQTRMNNLIGDLKLLRSALETALIQTGTAANSALRDMVQWVTRLINIYNQLPPGLQQAAGLLTGLVGIIGLVGASMLLLVPRILVLRRELLALGITAATVRAQLMVLGNMTLVFSTLVALSWGIDKLVDKFQEAPPNITRMTNALVDFAQRGKVAGELTRNFGKDLDGFGEAVARIAHPSVLNRVADFFSTFDPGAEHGPGGDEAVAKIKAVDEALASLVKSGNSKLAAESFRRFAEEAEAGGTSTEKLRTLLPQYAEALTNADTQTKLAADSQGDLAAETSVTNDEMADQRSEAEKLSDALKTLNGTAINSAEAEISFRDSLAQLNEAVKENGHSLNVTTEKGRAVKGAYLDAAKAAMEHAQAVAEQSGSQAAGNAILAKNIGILRQTMVAAGFTTKQIDDLTAAYTQLPSDASTKVTAPGAVQAIREVENLYTAVANLQPGKTIVVKAPTSQAVKELRAAGFAVDAIKGTKNVKVTAPTKGAVDAVAALKRALDNLRDRSVTVTTVHRTVENNTLGRPQRGEGGNSKYAGGGRVRRYAGGGTVLSFPGGGPVMGVGSSTSDSNPALLSNDEFVMRAAAVRKYGLGVMNGLNSMTLGVLPGRHFTSSPAPVAAASAGGGIFTGELYLDSGEFLGAVRGTVRPMIRESEKQQAYRAKVGRA